MSTNTVYIQQCIQLTYLNKNQLQQFNPKISAKNSKSKKTQLQSSTSASIMQNKVLWTQNNIQNGCYNNILVINTKKVLMKQQINERKQKQPTKFIPTPFNPTQNIKKKQQQDARLYSKSNKENQDIQWLEGIVKQFQHYRGQKGLDGNEGDKGETVGKVSARVGVLTSCQRLSSANDYNKKNTQSKQKQIKHEIILKNLPSTRHQHQQKKSLTTLRQPQQKAHIPTTTQILNSIEICGFSNTSNLTVEKNKQSNIIQEDNNRINNKFSLQDVKNSNNNKMMTKKQAVKEDRKYLVGDTGKVSIGRIVKNKSVEVKQKRMRDGDERDGQQLGCRNFVKNNFCQQKLIERCFNNQIQNLLGKSRQKRTPRLQPTSKQNQNVDQPLPTEHQKQSLQSKISKKQLNQYLNQNTRMIEMKKKQNNEGLQNLQQKQKLNRNQNEEQKNIGKLYGRGVQINHNNANDNINININDNDNGNDNYNGNGNRNDNAKNVGNQVKKYYYFIDTLEGRMDRLSNKKQRKLNSSFGDRKILNYDYSTLDNLSSSKKRFNYQSSSKILHTSPLEETEKLKTLRLSQFSTANIHCVSSPKLHSTTPKPSSSIKPLQPYQQKQNSVQKAPILQTRQPVQAPKIKQESACQDLRALSIGNRVKLVESTKNSQVFTQHSLVIQKSQVLNNQDEQVQSQQDWNVVQIFSKLDRKKNGILSADNCSIQYVSREIRYILGTVLEEILYKDVRYDFSAFIARVQTNLQQIKDPSSSYQKLKQFAPSTRRSRQSLTQTNVEQNIPNLTQTNKSSHINDLQSSIITANKLQQPIRNDKKYKYCQVFINEVETEPTHTVHLSENKSINKQSTMKIVRFATFQDQDKLDNKDEKSVGKLFGGELVESRSTARMHDVWNVLTPQQQLQRRLQQRLSNLNQFKSTTKPNININAQLLSQPLGTQLSNQYSSQYTSIQHELVEKKQYKKQIHKTEDHSNEMLKLELLNKRLEKYLEDQTMKQFCTSKLVIDDH